MGFVWLQTLKGNRQGNKSMGLFTPVGGGGFSPPSSQHHVKVCAGAVDNHSIKVCPASRWSYVRMRGVRLNLPPPEMKAELPEKKKQQQPGVEKANMAGVKLGAQ